MSSGSSLGVWGEGAGPGAGANCTTPRTEPPRSCRLLKASSSRTDSLSFSQEISDLLLIWFFEFGRIYIDFYLRSLDGDVLSLYMWWALSMSCPLFAVTPLGPHRAVQRYFSQGTWDYNLKINLQILKIKKTYGYNVLYKRRVPQKVDLKANFCSLSQLCYPPIFIIKFSVQN